jgi:hypothetical protein
VVVLVESRHSLVVLLMVTLLLVKAVTVVRMLGTVETAMGEMLNLVAVEEEADTAVMVAPQSSVLEAVQLP